MGLRNFALGIFGNLNVASELGFLFQNFILNILKEKLRFSAGEVHFWRTKDKAEADFIVELGKEIIPVEVKFKELRKPEIKRSLKNFIARYKPKRTWVVNLTFKETVKLGKTEVEFLPFYELILASGLP